MESAPETKLIGDRPFGITIDRIRQDVTRWQNNIIKANQKLAEENLPTGLRDTIESMKADSETALKFQPEEILEQLKKVYDFIKSREHEGLSKKDTIQALKREEPELAGNMVIFGDSVGGQAWVYSTVQALFISSVY